MSVSSEITEIPPGKIAAVVTSLEMKSRPALRPEQPHRSFSLERIQQIDLAQFRDLFRRTGEDWLWFSRLAMSDEALRAIVHDPKIEVYPLMAGSEAAGLLELDFRTTSECELSFFGLTPKFIGSGAGRWMMNRAIERAWSQPIRRFWVHTCTLDHPSAISFYTRSGFRAFRRGVEIADDPRLKGVLPRTVAPNVPIIE